MRLGSARYADGRVTDLGFGVEPPHPCLQAPPASAAVGDGLRRLFDDVVAAPMPNSLIDLCDALDDAFRSGKLTACSDPGKRV